MSKLRLIPAIITGTTVMIALSAAAWSGGEDPAAPASALQELTDRVKTLEDSLGLLPKETLTPAVNLRLKRAEDDMADMQKRFRDAGTGLPDRLLEGLQREVEHEAERSESLDKRLSALERDLRPQTELAANVRQLQSELSSMRQAISDLDRRLSKVEKK